MKERNKVAAGVFGIIFGSYGAHHFYLKNTGRGVLYLLLSLFIPIAQIVFMILGYVEGFRFLMMTDDEFEAYCKDLPVSKNKNKVLTNNNKAITDSNNDHWVDELKEIKNLYDCSILTEDEFNNEKKRIMSQRKINENVNNTTLVVLPSEKSKISGKYVNEKTIIIIENESFFTIKSQGLIISQGRIKEENNQVVFTTKDNKKMTFTKQGVDLVTIKGVIYKKQ